MNQPPEAEAGLVQSTEGITVEGEDVYRLEYDPSVDDPSLVVVEIVAAVSGANPVKLEPLYAAIDPSALDELCSDTRKTCRITFQYASFDVTVDSSGVVTCEPARGRGSA